MNRNQIIASAERFTKDSPANYISEDIAVSPEYAGMKIFDAPIFAFGSPDDELYEKYKSADVIGKHFLSPAEWMASTKTVISFFLPYTERIRTSNASDYRWPSDELLQTGLSDMLLLIV